MLFPFLSAGIGASLGLSLGANDGGNLFGTAVATRVISFRFAALLAGIAIIAGAYFQGAINICHASICRQKSSSGIQDHS